MLGILLSTSTLAATVRLSAPLALATMGSVFGHKAKIFNIGLESYVLTSAFFATWAATSSRTRSLGCSSAWSAAS